MQIDLARFAATPATHVVSLGFRCATAYAVRRFFGFGDAFPFDWWITPHAGLVGVLDRPEIDFIYDPARLERVDGGTTVRHRDLQILLHHEFPRRWADGRYDVIEDWAGSIRRPRERSTYLMNKFLALDDASHRLLFVREVKAGTEAAEIEPRLEALFPRAQWALAPIPAIDIAGGKNWRGDASAWDAALGALGVTLDTSRLKPFLEGSDPEGESMAKVVTVA